MATNHIAGILDHIDPQIRAILYHALEGEELSWQDGLQLCQANGIDFHAVCLVADEMRRRQVGEVVTYVVNRNINFTNVCIKHCTFCAFSREYREEEGYFLPEEEIVRRAQEAVDMGATEVCMQAGLPPKMNGSLYIDLTRAVKKGISRPPYPRLFARRSPVRLAPLGGLHSRLCTRTQKRGAGYPARHLSRNSGSGNPRYHRPRAHFDQTMDRGHYLGP